MTYPAFSLIYYAATKNDCKRKIQQFTSFLRLNSTIWFSWTLYRYNKTEKSLVNNVHSMLSALSNGVIIGTPNVVTIDGRTNANLNI